MSKHLSDGMLLRVRTGFAASCVVAMLCCAVSPSVHAAARDVVVIRGDGVAVLFQVEIADTVMERAQGLMHRVTLDARTGMLFDFGRESGIRMWMKNTLIALDMLFLGENGDIRHIAADTVPLSEALIVAPEPARYVLEINAGEAARFGLGVGDRLLLPPR